MGTEDLGSSRNGLRWTFQNGNMAGFRQNSSHNSFDFEIQRQLSRQKIVCQQIWGNLILMQIKDKLSLIHILYKKLVQNGL